MGVLVGRGVLAGRRVFVGFGIGVNAGRGVGVNVGYGVYAENHGESDTSIAEHNTLPQDDGFAKRPVYNADTAQVSQARPYDRRQAPDAPPSTAICPGRW